MAERSVEDNWERVQEIIGEAQRRSSHLRWRNIAMMAGGIVVATLLGQLTAGATGSLGLFLLSAGTVGWFLVREVRHPWVRYWEGALHLVLAVGLIGGAIFATAAYLRLRYGLLLAFIIGGVAIYRFRYALRLSPSFFVAGASLFLILFVQTISSFIGIPVDVIRPVLATIGVVAAFHAFIHQVKHRPQNRGQGRRRRRAGG